MCVVLFGICGAGLIKVDGDGWVGDGESGKWEVGSGR